MTTSPLKQKVQIVAIAKDQLLLLQFTEDRGCGYQNITGSVEFGENFTEAAVRELAEETGIKSNVIDIHFTFNFHDRWGSDVEEKIFLYYQTKKPEISLSPEHQSFKWVPVADVTVKDFSFPTNYEAFLLALKYVQENLK